jgi:hypothetical protein
MAESAMPRLARRETVVRPNRDRGDIPGTSRRRAPSLAARNTTSVNVIPHEA